MEQDPQDPHPYRRGHFNTVGVFVPPFLVFIVLLCLPEDEVNLS